MSMITSANLLLYVTQRCSSFIPSRHQSRHAHSRVFWIKNQNSSNDEQQNNWLNREWLHLIRQCLGISHKLHNYILFHPGWVERWLLNTRNLWLYCFVNFSTILKQTTAKKRWIFHETSLKVCSGRRKRSDFHFRYCAFVARNCCEKCSISRKKTFPTEREKKKENKTEKNACDGEKLHNTKSAPHHDDSQKTLRTLKKARCEDAKHATLKGFRDFTSP